MKKVIAIIGTNGSGKTTFYNSYLKEKHKEENISYINADDISEELQKNGIEKSQAIRKSGNLAMQEMFKYLKEGKSFAFETLFTDSSPMGSIAILNEFKKNGYQIYGYHLSCSIDNANENIFNVANRYARNTGHYVEPEIIKKRFELSLYNIEQYSEVFDKLYLYQNNNRNLKYIGSLENEKLNSIHDFYREHTPIKINHNLTYEESKNIVKDYSEKSNFNMSIEDIDNIIYGTSNILDLHENIEKYKNGILNDLNNTEDNYTSKTIRMN
jgi:predicted ABC-type ATPase